MSKELRTMQIHVSDKALHTLATDCYVLMLQEGFSWSKELKEFSEKIYPDLQQYLKNSNFTGKKGEIRMIPVVSKGLSYICLVGIGAKSKKMDVEILRRAIAQSLRRASQDKQSNLAICARDFSLFGSIEYVLEQATVAAYMANYQYTDYFSDKSRIVTPITEITFAVDKADLKKAQAGVDLGKVVGTAVNKARHWIDTPPNDMNPAYLASQAEKIAKAEKLDVTIFSEQELVKMGMGGITGVSRGSELDCKLVILEYKTKKKRAPTVAFVGKGITFDSGGLSLKPAVNMETMKEDMSGAAAVIVAMEAIAQIKPDINIIGIAPISENLPSGSATKPGDIVRFYNGKTAEVKNTDAEGRLVLADALSYAVKHYKPDAIIDVATLTGSCAYALGPFFTGLMSQHDTLAEQVKESAQRTGDYVWRLPMHDDFKAAIVSPVADLCNAGNPKYRAGAITAAHFLQNFVADIPWVHLDIAGTSFDVPDIPYYRPGATGAGVRLLIDLAQHWK